MKLVRGVRIFENTELDQTPPNHKYALIKQDGKFKIVINNDGEFDASNSVDLGGSNNCVIAEYDTVSKNIPVDFIICTDSKIKGSVGYV